MQSKLASYVMYALLLVSVVVFLLSVVWDIHNPMLVSTYIFAGITLLVALGGAIQGMISNPSSAKGTLIGVGIMLLVVGVSYGLADGTDGPANISETTVKWSGAGLIAFYILFIGAILSIIYTAISRLWK